MLLDMISDILVCVELGKAMQENDSFIYSFAFWFSFVLILLPYIVISLLLWKPFSRKMHKVIRNLIKDRAMQSKRFGYNQESSFGTKKPIRRQTSHFQRIFSFWKQPRIAAQNQSNDFARRNTGNIRIGSDLFASVTKVSSQNSLQLHKENLASHRARCFPFSPCFQRSKQNKGRTYNALWKLTTLCSCFPIERLIKWISVVAYTILSVPALITIDIALMTRYLITPMDNLQHLAYYERLRLISECLFESLPQAAFQLFLSQKVQFKSIDSSLLAISIMLAIFAIMKNFVQLKWGADDNEETFSDYVGHVLTAGLASIPLVRVRDGRIRHLRFIFELNEEEKKNLAQALQSQSCRVYSLR